MTDRPTDQQTDRPTDRQTDRQTQWGIEATTRRLKMRELNKAKLLEQVRSRNYKKIDFDKISSNNFEQKPYLSSLSVPDARLRFKIVGFMTPTVRMNSKQIDILQTNFGQVSHVLTKGVLVLGIPNTTYW